jgi:hypothetical protein
MRILLLATFTAFATASLATLLDELNETAARNVFFSARQTRPGLGMSAVG